MKKTQTDMQQVHFLMRKEGYDELSRMAEVQETSASNLMRRYVKEGTLHDKFRENGGEIIYRKNGKEYRKPPS